MFKLWLSKTDAFLCKSVQTIFDKTENIYKSRGLQINIAQELRNFEAEPLVCVMGSYGSSRFEKSVKIKIRALLGIFFVAIPLIGFNIVTYLFNIDYLFAFMATFAVAMAVSYRMDEIAKRYVHSRLLFA